MGNQQLENVLHLKYLGVLQSGDGELTILVNHKIFVAHATSQNLKRPINDKNLPLTLRRLYIFGSSVVFTLLYGCKSGNLAKTVLKKLNLSCTWMLLQTTGKLIAEEAHALSMNGIARPRDRRWM